MLKTPMQADGRAKHRPHCGILKLPHGAIEQQWQWACRARVHRIMLSGCHACPWSMCTVVRDWGAQTGAAMAVGVSCAGTGMRAAVDLLAPLLTDAVDFVRQGALIATSLVLMQQPEARVGGSNPPPCLV